MLAYLIISPRKHRQYSYNGLMFSAEKMVGAWKESVFIKNNAVFWTASLGVSFINYLYYPVMGRLLDPAAFGETQAAISIYTQAGVFFQVLGLVTVGIITKYSDKTVRDKISDELSRLSLMLSLVMLAATVIFSPLLKEFFNFGSVAPFLVLSLALLVSVPLALANSYLQGHKKFWTFAKGNLLSSISRIILSAILVTLGAQAAGAVGGLLCAQVLALGYALHKGRGLRHFVNEHLHLRFPKLGVLKSEVPYIAVVLATAITTNLILSFDILVVKHAFPPAEAGYYTGISIISNIIFFITGPLAMVMIPSLKPTQTKAKNYYFLKRSLFLTILIGGSVLMLFSLLPNLVVRVLLGGDYVDYAHFLPGLSMALFMLSLSNLLIYYHIGLRHLLVAPAVVISLVFTLLLIIQAEASMQQIVRSLITGSGILLALQASLMLYYRNTREVN